MVLFFRSYVSVGTLNSPQGAVAFGVCSFFSVWLGSGWICHSIHGSMLGCGCGRML